MTNLEKISAMLEDFRSLAKLHKHDLIDTQELPNYNASFIKLLQMKKLFNSGELFKPRKITSFETFYEMKEEICNMVSEEKLELATDLYRSILKNLREVTEVLSKSDISHLVDIPTKNMN
jgi:adenine-specific DNA methylase